jgi:hypothetical protein
MRATRDRRVNDPIYLQYLDDLAKEQAAIKAEQDALADQTPEAMYKRAADAEAQTILELLRTGYVPESVLPVERINGRSVIESAKINNFKWFAENEPNFERWMAEQLIDAAFRNDIVPVAPNYKKLHELMLQYSAYEEPAQPVAQPEPASATEPTSRIAQWKPSEKFKVEQANLDKVFALVDGVEISERYLNSLPSREELKIRRKLEKGYAGNQNFDTFLEIKDAQFERDAEIARRAREDER